MSQHDYVSPVVLALVLLTSLSLPTPLLASGLAEMPISAGLVEILQLCPGENPPQSEEESARAQHRQKTITYKNVQYGFTFTVPRSWKKYSILVSTWTGGVAKNDETTSGEHAIESGPLITIRSPRWTEVCPWQDIPIMVFTMDQWKLVDEGTLAVSAAPFGPGEIGRNSKYVFALPPRYNYADANGIEEVVNIIRGGPLHAFDPKSPGAQNFGGGEQEQSSFGGEEVPGVPFIKRPVAVPDTVLQILREDETVKSCLVANVPSPETPLASWFVASEVHLGGRQERDLMVLPSPRERQPDYLCFHSVEGFTRFWVFRLTHHRYQLALNTAAFGIEIAKKRHFGYRDIETASPSFAGRFTTTVTFHFDSTQYQEYRSETRESQ